MSRKRKPPSKDELKQDPRFRPKRERKKSRRKPYTVPKGLIPTHAEGVEKAFARMMEQARAHLSSEGLESRAIVNLNQNYTVDADLTVEVPRGTTVRSVLLDLEHALRGISRIKGSWVSVGIRVPPSPSEHKTGLLVSRRTGEPLRGGKGVYQAGTYYQRLDRRASTFATGKAIVKNFARKGRRKPTQVFVRLHWNPYDMKPTREG